MKRGKAVGEADREERRGLLEIAVKRRWESGGGEVQNKDNTDKSNLKGVNGKKFDEKRKNRTMR